MPSTIAAEKKALRQRCRSLLDSLSDEELRRSDAAIFARFLTLPQVREAGKILLYHGMGSEPDTAKLIAPLEAMGKTVALPRCLPGNQMEFRAVQRESKLVLHPFGMWEPGEDCPLVDGSALDLVVVPGLAFDRKGGRLGRGGGFYDRWLSAFSGVSVALCRDKLLYEQLPREEHDLGVDLVVTESGLWGLST